MTLTLHILPWGETPAGLPLALLRVDAREGTTTRCVLHSHGLGVSPAAADRAAAAFAAVGVAVVREAAEGAGTGAKP